MIEKGLNFGRLKSLHCTMETGRINVLLVPLCGDLTMCQMTIGAHATCTLVFSY